MSSKFVFGETKVAQTAQEIREHENQSVKPKNTQADAASEAETKPTENAPVEPENESEKAESEAAETSSPKPSKRKQKSKNTLTNESFAVKGKKTENGIVVNVPMDDYMQLTMMKFQTGRTLKDLALQAIHEFVERNK